MSAHTERGIVTKYVCCPRRTRDRLRSKIARREAVVVESQADRQVAGKLLMGKTGRGEYRGRPRTRRGTWTQPYRSEAEKGCRLFSFGPALTMSHLPYHQPVRISDTRLSILRLRPCNWRVYVYIYIYVYTYSFHEHLRCVRSWRSSCFRERYELKPTETVFCACSPAMGSDDFFRDGESCE